MRGSSSRSSGTTCFTLLHTPKTVSKFNFRIKMRREMRRQQLLPLSPSFCHSPLSLSLWSSAACYFCLFLHSPRLSLVCLIVASSASCCHFWYIKQSPRRLSTHMLTPPHPLTLSLPSPSPHSAAATVQVAMELSSSHFFCYVCLSRWLC